VTLRNSFLDAISRILLRERREQSLELLLDFLATEPYFPGSIDELAVVGEKVGEVRRRFAFQSGKKTAHRIHALQAGFDARGKNSEYRRASLATIALAIACQLQANFARCAPCRRRVTAGKRVFLAQQPKQKMLGANMPLSHLSASSAAKLARACSPERALRPQWKSSPRWICFSISCWIAWQKPEPIILLSKGKFSRIDPTEGVRHLCNSCRMARVITREEYPDVFFRVALEHETNPVQNVGW
jgi:hypothetical protein